MTAKEKAIELIKIYISICKQWNIDYVKSKEIKKLKEELFNLEWFIPKQCALIAVDEVIAELVYDKQFEYWQLVKQEIEKI